MMNKYGRLTHLTSRATSSILISYFFFHLGRVILRGTQASGNYNDIGGFEKLLGAVASKSLHLQSFDKVHLYDEVLAGCRK